MTNTTRLTSSLTVMAATSKDHHGLPETREVRSEETQAGDQLVYSNPEVKFKNVPTGARPTPLA